MRLLVDTNVLLRSAQPDHPSFFQSSESVVRLLQQSHQLFFCPQNIVEFWNVATRPLALNGLGLPQERVLQEIADIENSLSLLPDVAPIHPVWKQIVTYQVLGTKVHDARLVAVMVVYRVAYLPSTLAISTVTRISKWSCLLRLSLPPEPVFLSLTERFAFTTQHIASVRECGCGFSARRRAIRRRSCRRRHWLRRGASTVAIIRPLRAPHRCCAQTGHHL